MEKISFYDYYTKTEESTTLPDASKYQFLLERNRHYMDYVALSFNNTKITYAELHDRIDEYTRALAKIGIKKGDKIAVCLANTPEAVYLLYALDRLGAITIGLSPLNNEYKMRRDLEIAKPKMLITVDMFYKNSKKACDCLNIFPILHSPLESTNNFLLKAIYHLKQLSEGNAIEGKEHNLKAILKSGQGFYRSPIYYTKDAVSDIMFTGGSTGIHKGVCLTANGLNCVVKALDYVLKLEPGMVHLGNIPFGHMAFGRLVEHYVLCNNLEFALTLNMLPDKFMEEMIRTHCDGAMGGPVHWDNIIAKTGDLSNLKQAMSGGEALKPKKRDLINASLKSNGSSALLGDGLGLTEMWAPTHVNYGGINTPGTIGFPIPFVKSKIVDPTTLQEVEHGAPGLLFVSGPGMMQGYYENPEETAKVFFTDQEGTRWYNTGDICIQTGIDENEFQFYGRQKRNFVSGVDNIYPEQIENLLLTLPEIKEVIVVGVPDDKYQNLPSYHITLTSECDEFALQLKIEQLIESTLGASALPGYLSFSLNPQPRTDNGKLNAPLLEKQDLELYQAHSLTLVRKKY